MFVSAWHRRLRAGAPYCPTVPFVSLFLNTLKSRVAMKPNSLSQASDSVAIISAMDVSPPTLDRRL